MRLRKRSVPGQDNGDIFAMTERWRAALEALSPHERLMRSGGFLGLYGRIAERLPGQRAIVQFVGPEGGEGTSVLAWEFAYTVATASARSVLLLQDNKSGMRRLDTWAKLLAENVIEAADSALPRLEGSPGETGSALCVSSVEALPLARRPTDMALGTLREEFELIVIDSLPLTQNAESVLLARKVDGVVLVVRTDRTSAAATEAAKCMIEGAGATLLGVVLNTGQD
jgi:hypothetical protein